MREARNVWLGDMHAGFALDRSRLLISELRLTVDPDAQSFEVVFRDGQGMILFVDPEHPTKFIQKVMGTAPDFEMISADGKTMKSPADEAALDEK
ncbi:hypothetical protein [Bradyrhizobium guangxiense]|uniref:hypothetical protein n=1 Tax=Bradyrhizobium guangxiense TaxID=1325115 RepID=UPI001008850A|nr:hypothetical protein [Bradyrhizobium guangxiense]